MSKAIRLGEDMVGNKVRCINKVDCHHPEVGTIGTIVIYDKHDTDSSYKVQWPKGSTMYDDRWWAINKCIELVEDDVTNEQEIPDMNNEEIWEMLRPKMEKNGLKPCGSHPLFTGGIANVYDCNDVHNAIAIAYRSGYERAMKGRPFKFGEKNTKKQGGHWEPVDPNNLPKEGTKVRYAESRGHIFGLYDGDTGTVVDGLGFNVNMNRINLVIHTSKIIGKYFDMWVEDDE